MPRGLFSFVCSSSEIVTRWTGDKGLVIFMIPMLSAALPDTMTYVEPFIVNQKILPRPELVLEYDVTLGEFGLMLKRVDNYHYTIIIQDATAQSSTQNGHL